MGEADGQEVLVVDPDEGVQRGLQQLFAAAGLLPTVTGDVERARQLVHDKFFPVAVIDLDSPRPNAGLELLRRLKHDTPTMMVFVLASRRSFDSAVEAFRAGASDVVVKAPDQVEYLKERVVAAATSVRQARALGRLGDEMLAAHEEFLKRLMEQSRRIVELEEQLSGHSHDADEECSILVVEPIDGNWLAAQLGDRLRGRAGYRVVSCGSGGEGLDYATRARFNLALICEHQPDLPGRMVVATFKRQSPDTVTILYTRPAKRPGKADIVDGSKVIPLVAELSDVGQVVDRIDELRDAAQRTRRERRYLAAFRQENYELLRRYAELKQKLQRTE